MLFVIITGLFAVAVALFVDGTITKRGPKLKPEVSRKIVHVTNYTMIAFWPFFTSYKVVIAIELVFLLIAILARKYHWTNTVSNVYRLTWGEQFGALGTIVIALMNPNPWIFATAMLFVGLADAAAALVGKSIGKYKYMIFGNKKTLEGSTAFALTAFLIMIVMVQFMPSDISVSWPLIILLPLATTAIEGISPFGLDNFLIPLVVVIVLNSAQLIS